MPNGWKKNTPSISSKDKRGGSSRKTANSSRCYCIMCLEKRSGYKRNKVVKISNRTTAYLGSTSSGRILKNLKTDCFMREESIPLLPQASKPVTEQKECLICAGTYSFKNFTTTSCGHELCNVCFDTLKPQLKVVGIHRQQSGRVVLDNILKVSGSNCPFCRVPMFGNYVSSEEQHLLGDL